MSRGQDVETGCAERLTFAENEFNAGRFYGVPSIVKECIDKGSYSNEQLVRVYMLLTQVYLVVDDPLAAEQSYLKLLAADPEFIASQERDPIDVYYLSKKFTTTPIFTPHFKAGVLQTSPSLIRDNATFGNSSLVQRQVVPRIGWTIGAGIEWNITNNWGLGGEALLSAKSFDINYSGGFGNDRLNTTERQLWADIPIYVRFTDHIGRFRPFAYAGHTFNLLLNSKWKLAYTDVQGDGQVQVEGPDVDITFNRQFLNRGLLIGAGMKMKTGKNFLVLDVRYNAGLSNISKGSYYESASASDPVLFSGITRYAANSNDLLVNNLAVTIGYVRPLYDPRKIVKPNARGLFKKRKAAK